MNKRISESLLMGDPKTAANFQFSFIRLTSLTVFFFPQGNFNLQLSYLMRGFLSTK